MSINALGNGPMMGAHGMAPMQPMAGRMAGGEGFPPPPMGGDSSRISKAAEHMQELSKLAEQDPEQFAETTAAIAQELSAMAEETGGQQSEVLSKMAGKFQEASETGSMDALRPDGPPPGMMQGGRGGVMQRMGGQAFGGGFTVQSFTETIDMIGSTVESGLSGELSTETTAEETAA